MNAVELMGLVKRKFACRLDLVSGREFDVMARQSEAGGACAQCGECERGLGVIGVAAEGIEIVRSMGGMDLRWKCPGCGGETHETTSVLTTFDDAAAVAKDGLCYRCRRKSANAT